MFLAVAVAAVLGAVLSVARPGIAHAVVPSTTTVRGTVTLNGRALARVPVGTWSGTAGVLSSGHTDSRGRFTLRTPRGIAVFAYAGNVPSSPGAVFQLGSRHLVRGVIGARRPAHLADALAQGIGDAVPSKLAGGRAIDFRLQRAGRFTGASSDLAAAADSAGSVFLQYGSGVYGAQMQASTAGSFASPWLVPGRYRLYWDPSSDVRPARSRVTVRSGSTAHAATPRFSRGASVTIRVVDAATGAPVPDALPVVQTFADGTQDGSLGMTSGGALTVRNQAAGTLHFTVGRFFDDPDEGLGEGQTQPTSDDWLPVSKAVTIDAHHDAVTIVVPVIPAAHLTGTIAAALRPHDQRDVVAENSSGVPVRGEQGVPAGTNAFDLGALPAGDYTVTAIDTHADGTQGVYATSAAVHVDAGQSASAGPSLAPATSEPTVLGTVARGTDGSVSLGVSFAYVASGDFGRSGHYSLSTIPGTFPVSVDEAYHFTGDDGSVTVGASGASKNLSLGPAFASAIARFTVHGRPRAVAIDAVDGVVGDAFSLDPHGTNGMSTAADIVPAQYRWKGTPSTVLADDGPWYYSTPRGSFTLKAGRTTNLGTLRLVIRH